jgi:hypothetical protein
VAGWDRDRSSAGDQEEFVGASSEVASGKQPSFSLAPGVWASRRGLVALAKWGSRAKRCQGHPDSGYTHANLKRLQVGRM